MAKRPKKVKLSFPQVCMTANFYDASVDFSCESFAQITKRLLGMKRFAGSQNAAAFRRECRKEFESFKAK